MSLINRQKQKINMPASIETPSSIWMQGQEHDASTLSPLFGKQFHYIAEALLVELMSYTNILTR
jgi:hypothetical protein